MKYNFFLESDDEDDEDEDKDKDDDDDFDEKDKDDEKNDDEDEEDSSNDYLGDTSDDGDSDFDDEPSSDDDLEDSGDDIGNDYLGGDTSEDSDTGMGEEGSDDNGLFNKVAKCAYASVVVSNNMKHVHLHISGKMFDRTHGLSQDYYDAISGWTDDLCELALEDKATKIDNLSNSAQYVAEITLETEEYYNYDAACTAMTANLRHMIECVKCVRCCCESRTDIQSKFDEYILYLNKQINFLMERRQSTNESFSFNIR